MQYIVQSQELTLRDSGINKFIAYITKRQNTCMKIHSEYMLQKFNCMPTTSSKEYYSEAIGTEHS